MRRGQENSHILLHAKFVDLWIQGLDVDLDGRLWIISRFNSRAASPMGSIINHPAQASKITQPDRPDKLLYLSVGF
jgi:hypothetical protein